MTAPTTHTLGPVAAKTVEAIRAQPDSQRRYIRAVIGVEGEAYAALRAYDEGWFCGQDPAEFLRARLRDILAICEAVDTPLPQRANAIEATP